MDGRQTLYQRLNSPYFISLNETILLNKIMKVLHQSNTIQDDSDLYVE